MLKRIFYVLIIAAITAGAYYSYQGVGFARKTTFFFQVMSGTNQAATGHGGAAGSPSGTAFAAGGGGARPEGHGGGARPSGGSLISLGKVWQYAFIFAFFGMIARMADIGLRKLPGRR